MPADGWKTPAQVPASANLTTCASGEFADLYPLHSLMQVEFIPASGTPTVPVLVLIWSVVVVVVVACCCCILLQLALMLVLTFAPCTGVPFFH